MTAASSAVQRSEVGKGETPFLQNMEAFFCPLQIKLHLPRRYACNMQIWPERRIMVPHMGKD